LSLVALEAPRERRGVVVVMPADWDPPAAVLEATLDGLRGHPALTPGTLAQFFERVPVDERAGVPLERQLDGGDEGAFSSPDPAEVRAARSELVAFTGVVGSDRPVVSSVDRALLTSQSLRLPRSGPLSAAAYLEGATGMMHEVTGVVRGPDGQVTLTARQADLPVSLLNPNAFPLTVLVRLESDQLLFPDGAQRLVTLPPENTTEPFAVETRASGAFPLRITVTSPDGRMVVTRSELTIRSTVVSGVGAMLTAGAGVFLLVWWGNDLRRSRRRRRLSVQQH
ncbi:MAG: DUF6049 family protein, partial [Acidimicrobiia bacterium]